MMVAVFPGVDHLDEVFSTRTGQVLPPGRRYREPPGRPTHIVGGS